MNDPVRLLAARGVSEFERALLESWGREAPPSGARGATLAALGLAAAPVVASKSASTLGWTKWMLFALAAGAIPLEIGSRPCATKVQGSPTTLLSVSAPSTMPQGGVVGSRRLVEANPTERPALGRHVAHTKSVLRTDSLHEQVEQLDRARVALGAGDAEKALALLASYEARFSHGALLEEAQVIRIEALFAAGRPEEAKRLTAAFASDHPDSPHIARIRQLGAM